jgi:long-chain acyl-CoA synthetase
MDKVVASVIEHKVTRFYAVPTIFIRILNSPESRKQLKSLRYVFSGGTSMPAEIVRQWFDAFGIPIHEAYGMTEAASIVTFNHLFRHKIGSIGMPAGIIELKVVDADDNEMKQGEQGEIILRGPNIMKGYFEQPEESAMALRNGWFHSGDVGVFDAEGYLYIVDRIKDLVITGGENVYPKEVETIVLSHPAVADVAVVPAAHSVKGQAPVAFVVLKTGAHATEDEIKRHCLENGPAYAHPRRVFFVDSLPMSSTNKLDRGSLKVRAVELLPQGLESKR